MKLIEEGITRTHVRLGIRVFLHATDAFIVAQQQARHEQQRQGF